MTVRSPCRARDGRRPPRVRSSVQTGRRFVQHGHRGRAARRRGPGPPAAVCPTDRPSPPSHRAGSSMPSARPSTKSAPATRSAALHLHVSGVRRNDADVVGDASPARTPGCWGIQAIWLRHDAERHRHRPRAPGPIVGATCPARTRLPSTCRHRSARRGRTVSPGATSKRESASDIAPALGMLHRDVLDAEGTDPQVDRAIGSGRAGSSRISKTSSAAARPGLTRVVVHAHLTQRQVGLRCEHENEQSRSAGQRRRRQAEPDLDRHDGHRQGRQQLEREVTRETRSRSTFIVRRR